MNADELRAEIIRYLAQVQDESFLRVVHSMLNTYTREQENPIIGYEPDGTPVHANTVAEQGDAAVGMARQGKYISVQELVKKSENLLNQLQQRGTFKDIEDPLEWQQRLRDEWR